MKRVPGTLLVVALVSITLAPAAFAETDESRFSLSLGMFVTDRDSDTRLDASGEPAGTPVDLERDLGLDVSDTVFRLDGYFLFNDKHRIDFSAFDLSRTSSKTITKEIDWNGTIYPLSIVVNADFDLNIYKVAYTWSFMRREKGFLGLTGGVYAADLGARLSAENIAERDGGGITAPLPVIGLRGEYRFSDKWTFRASSEFFALKYEQFDGSLTDIYAGIDYQMFKRAAIGLGVNSVRFDLDIEDNNLNGQINWRYDGGLIFFKFDF